MAGISETRNVGAIYPVAKKTKVKKQQREKDPRQGQESHEDDEQDDDQEHKKGSVFNGYA